MFTRCINVRNVNKALPEGIKWLLNRGREEPSRNGTVLVSPDPVITGYECPEERVLFSPMRDANPFFHFMEGLWMLAGRNDVEWIGKFNGRFREYSDDGAFFWGAYGHRWRNWFGGIDQLYRVIEQLRADPKDRRVVLTMWDGHSDPLKAEKGGKDVPCNTNVFFKIIGGQLHMMVNNRSNDAIWGAYGANAVHMSMMMEFVATAVGVKVGTYYQNSWNFHAYTDVYSQEQLLLLANEAGDHDYYAQHRVKPYPLMQINHLDWLDDLEDFMDGVEGGFEDPLFSDVAVPMQRSWACHKSGDYPMALDFAEQIAALDWQKACKAWLNRRVETRNRKAIQNG